jgi:hypothetical protein
MVSEVDKRIELAKRQLVSQRNYRRIRDRALARLAQAHQEQYLLLLERERARDEEMGKRWLDITGTTNSGQLIESYKDSIEGSTYTDPDNDGADEGNNGGEERE